MAAFNNKDNGTWYVQFRYTDWKMCIRDRAYHVSKGLPLWGYEVRQGAVLYMALEDDYPRLQGRLYLSRIHI